MSSSRWGIVKLGEVSKVLSGYAFKSKDFCESGVPVIKIKNITPPYVDLNDVQFVSNELAQEKEKYLLQYDDVLISMTGSNVNQFASAVGKVGRVKMHNKMLLNQRVGKFEIIDSDIYNLDFLYYLISTDEMHYKLALNASGAANQANISPSIIEDIELPHPSLPEQKAIAATLSCLDDKIELNNRMNKTLEEMAQVIFKSWFVDFEPFQDGEFEDSELGMIPKGWRVGTLGEFVEIVNGYSYKGTDLKESNDAMLTIKNFDRNKGFKLDGFKELEITDRVKDRHFIEEFDVLVACTDLTQNADIIGNSIMLLTKKKYDKIIASMDVVKVKPSNETIDSFFIHSVLNNERFKQYALGFTSGTTVLHLDKKSIGSYLVAVPEDLNLLKEFNENLRPIYMRIRENLNCSLNLLELRDTLLPKLMSGEIRVPIEEVQ